MKLFSFDEYKLSLFEKHVNQKYDYGCIMLEVEIPFFKELQDRIDVKDLFNNEANEYGFENEPHITILYGILDQNLPNRFIFDIIERWKKPVEFKLIGTSCFSNSERDVLKIDVESKDLVELNLNFKQLPFESNFPFYHPHITIAYLKPGTGVKYSKAFSGEQMKLYSSTVFIYSKSNGIKIKYDVKQNQNM